MKSLKRALVALALAVVAGAGSAQAAVPVLWSSASGGNDHLYQYVATQLTWHGALAAADTAVLTGYDAYLATATSAAENTFIKDLVLASVVSGSRRTWLAGTDEGTEGVWKWAAGPETGMVFWNGGSSGSTPAGAFASWLPGEPSNTGDEDFLSAYPLNNVLWNDTVDTRTQGYVVEYSAIPAPPTAGVPEATAWVLMILGFGASGAMLRRRRAGLAAA